MPNPCLFSPRNLQHEFTNHAPDFGIAGSWNKIRERSFKQAILAHVAGAPQQISGTFRGTILVTHYFEPATSLWVAVDHSDKFVAGWKLYPTQIVNLLTTGDIR